MHDGAIDFMEMIIVLAICLGLGLSVLMPMLNETEMMYTTSLEDKSAPVLAGSDELDDYDGTYNKTELILMTQVQDYLMPYPRKITVFNETNEINITSLYRPDMAGYASLLNSFISPDPESTRYKIEYNYKGVHNKDASGKRDRLDSYMITRVAP